MLLGVINPLDIPNPVPAPIIATNSWLVLVSEFNLPWITSYWSFLKNGIPYIKTEKSFINSILFIFES